MQRMRLGHLERGHVRGGIRAAGLKLHHAGVGKANLIRGVARMLLNELLERGARRGHAFALQRFERHAAFCRRSLRRQQQLQIHGGRPAFHLGDRRDELIPRPRHRADVALQIVGIQGRRSLLTSFARLLSPTAVCCQPVRIRTSFERTMFGRRTSRCGTSHSYGESPTSSPLRKRDLPRVSSR